MDIALLGATGMIGSRVAAEASNRGHRVDRASLHGDQAGQVAAVDLRKRPELAAWLTGHDALVVAARSGPAGLDQPDVVTGVLDALRDATISRVVVVGGAGTLEVAPGLALMDSAEIPDEHRVEVLAQAALLGLLQHHGGDLAWTYISPSALIAPGERTGRFRVGDDSLLVDDTGTSKISAEDFAVGLVDELEHPTHIRRRMTLGY